MQTPGLGHNRGIISGIYYMRMQAGIKYGRLNKINGLNKSMVHFIFKQQTVDSIKMDDQNKL